MPTDTRDFSEKALPTLRKAAEEVYFLLNHGYPTTSATHFIGDHYQLSERQRLALARCVSPEEKIQSRRSREIRDISGAALDIDGFKATPHVAKAVIHLDQPVSNSGRLRQRILELADQIPFELEIVIENPVDAVLKTKPLIATGDAIILDECSQWFNLVKYVVDTQIGSYPYIEITNIENQ